MHRAVQKLDLTTKKNTWKAPAAKSERIVLDAYQTWIVKRSPNIGKPVIETYIVDSMNYYEGSAQL